VRPGCLWHTPALGRADWLFVVGRSFLAAVDTAGNAAARVVIESLWLRADEPALTVEDIVGTFPLGKKDGVQSFAIVSFGAQPAPGALERTVTAVVRGHAIVDIFSVGGSRRFASGAVQPWMLADFRSVTGVIVGSDARPTRSAAALDSTALPVGVGVVRGQQLLWSEQPLTFASPEFSDGFSDGFSDRFSDGLGDGFSDRFSEGDAAGTINGEAARDGEAAASAVTAAELDQTILSPRRSGARVDPDDTVLVSRSGSRALPGEPGRPQPTAPLTAPHRFRLGDSAPRPLSEPAVFGRRPVAPRMPMGAAAQLVAVESPDAAVSAVHLRIEQQGGAVIVTDLHSRNGTAVRPPGGALRRLHPGEAVVVLAGTTIDIGDGNIIEIMPPGPADQSGSTGGPVRGGAA